MKDMCFVFDTAYEDFLVNQSAFSWRSADSKMSDRPSMGTGPW